MKEKIFDLFSLNELLYQNEYSKNRFEKELDKKNRDHARQLEKERKLAEKLEKDEERAAVESELGKEGEEMSSEFKQAYGFAMDGM